MSKKVRAAIVVIAMAIGIGCYLFMANRDYLFARGGESPIDGVAMVGWEQQGDRYVSQQDPQLVLRNVAGRVDRLRLDAQIGGAIRPVIYYTDSLFEDFSEEKKLIPAYTLGQGGVVFEIGRSLWSLRVDLAEEAGLVISQPQLFRTPAGFAAHPVDVACAAAIGGLLAIAAITPASAYRRAGAMLRGFRRYTYLLGVLVKRDLTTKYRRSFLGVLWSVLNPLLMMIVITVVFQRLFRFQVENFPIYYLTGALLFNFTVEATSGAMGSLVANGALMRKVYIPKYIFPLEKCLFALVNMLFSFVATIAMTFVLGIKPAWSMLLFPIPMLYTLVFSIGFGLMLATLNVFFRDVSHLYSVWTTAWMYLTPIIYPAEILPKSVLAAIQLNPLYHYVDYFRQIIMYGQLPGLRENITCALLAAVFLLLGLWFFRKKQDAFILHI